MSTRPTTYGPELAPPGVELRFLDRPNAAGVPLWQTRPFMSPRLALLHTNGASNPGSIASAFTWANQYNSNTKPHYQVQRDGSAAKLLPSNRVGIGNYRAAPFSLVIETQDLGYGPGRPGEAAGYTDEQADTICRILAFEHITAGGRIPLVVPTAWDGAGVGSHTDPFGYDQWTNARGKVCPGAAKKVQLRPLILPLADEYLAEWTDAPKPLPPPEPLPPPDPIDPLPLEDDDMTRKMLLEDSRPPHASWLCEGGTKSWVNAGDSYAQLLRRLEESCNLPANSLQPGALPASLTGVKPSPWDGCFYDYRKHGGNDVIASMGPVVGPIPGGFDAYGRLL